MFGKKLFPVVPLLVLWSPVKLFLDQFWKFLIRPQIALKASKTVFFIKTINLNSYKHVSKNFFSNGTPLVLWSPLKLFFDQFWKFLIRLQIALNHQKRFHQNNHFKLIETCLEKNFLQWSPFWSYGHLLRFFWTNFENF